jgi:hypothetical protein
MTGPVFHKTNGRTEYDSSGATIFYVGRDYYVEQRRPYTGVNPFTMRSATLLGWNHQETDKFGNSPPGPPQTPSLFVYAPSLDLAGDDLVTLRNKAYAKFTDRAKDSAQNANNILEAHQSIDSIVSKAKAIAASVNAVRKGDLFGAAKALGVSISGSKAERIRKRAKQAADAWLEYHFGWEPLVQDIGASIDILQGTGKSGRTGNGSNRTSSSQSVNITHSEDLSYDLPHIYQLGRDVTTISASVRMNAKVHVKNDNLSLANQMGFINPASVAWEAVPFSFVVDWFGNVGQCLNAMTDFAGISVEEGRTTYRVSGTRTYYTETHAKDPGDLGSAYSFVNTKAINHSRAAGVAGPSLQFRPTPLGATRGATAISLLVQQLERLKS